MPRHIESLGSVAVLDSYCEAHTLGIEASSSKHLEEASNVL